MAEPETSPEASPEQRRLQSYVQQLEDIFARIEGMLACKDLDSLERVGKEVQLFLLEMAVAELGAVAGEIRERRAVDETLPKRALFLDRRGLSEEVHEAAKASLRAHDPLGEEVREPWAGLLDRFEVEGFAPARVTPRPWLPRPALEGDLEPEVEQVFAQVGSVAVVPFLLRDHRPAGGDRERLCGLQVLYLREKKGERQEEIAAGLARLRTVGEVVLTNRVTMEGLLKKVATFRHQTQGKRLELQGSSPHVRNLRERVAALAAEEVERLRIEGPRGAGKKHLAERFHRLGPGASNPFVAVDCARLAAGGEGAGPADYAFRKRLFGDVHAADLDEAMGAIEQARGGTLFLDEVEHLPLSFQYKLAQVLQERRFSRIGEEARVSVDCRVILASNSDLAERVEARRFSSKLLRAFRDVPRVRVVGLNHRREDIPALVEIFLRQQAGSQKKPRLRGVAPECMRALVERDWEEGNVKALQNLIGWAVARAGPDDVELRCDHLPESQPTPDPRSAVDVFEADGTPRSFRDFVAQGLARMEAALGDRERALQAWEVSPEEVEPWLP